MRPAPPPAVALLGLLAVLCLAPRAEAAPPAPAAPRAAAAPPASAERPWTLLVYAAADNNADGPVLEFLDGVRKALDDDPGLELVLFVDRSPRYSDDATLLGEDFSGARLYRLTRERAERLAGDEELPEIRLEGDAELDSASPRTLQRFLAWGKRRFPARHTGLLIYSHADGRTMCPDETENRSMAIPELASVLGPGESLDFLALELCNMGGLEVAYEWRPAGEGEAPRFGADVLVAIPNAGPPLDWQRAFARLCSAGHASRGEGAPVDPATMSAADFGRLVIEEGRRGRELAASAAMPLAHEAAVCCDLRRARAAKLALDALAVELFRAGAREPFVSLRDPGASYEVCNFSEGGPFVDAADLCRRIARDEAFGEAARDAAERARAALDDLVLASFGMSAYPDFEPGLSGLFVVMPADEPSIWREFTWYTPLPGPRPSVYGRWAFLADGSRAGDGVVQTWFELLDAWHDTPDEQGGVNHYRW